MFINYQSKGDPGMPGDQGPKGDPGDVPLSLHNEEVAARAAADGVIAADLLSYKAETTSQLALKSTAVDLGLKANLLTTDKTSFEKAVNEVYNLLITKLSTAQIRSLIGFADINKNLSLIDSTMLTPELLTQIAGTAGVNVTPSALSVLTGMLADLSVTNRKTSFLKIQKNLIDIANPLLLGKFIAANGAIGTNSLFDTSNWIELTVGQQYTLSTANSYDFMYLSNYSAKNEVTAFVNRVDTNGLTPKNVYTFTATHPYVLVSYLLATKNSMQLEFGAVKTTYAPFYYVLDENIRLKDFNTVDISTRLNIAESDITTLKSDTINYNIFDQAYIKNGELVINKDHINGVETVAKYTGANLGEKALTVRCKCRFWGGGVVAIIAEPNGLRKVEDITLNSIHVTYSGLVGFVNVGYWKNYVMTNVRIDFTPLDVTGATVYELGWTVSDAGITVLLPNGTSQVVTSPEFQIANGKYIIWEHYCEGVTESVFKRPSFTEFYAIGASGSPITDNFLRQNGAIGISPSGHPYAQFRNTI